MPRSQQLTYSNVGGGRLEQSYDSASPFYGLTSLAGRPVNPQDSSFRSIVNGSGIIAQVNTITIGTAAVALYSVVMAIGVDNLEVTATYEAVNGDTAAIIQGKLRDALIASKAGSRIKFTLTAGTTITCTAIDGGTNGGFDMRVEGGGVSYAVVETTAPGNPMDLVPGRLLVAVPADQKAAIASNPTGEGTSIIARYPASAGDLDHVIGILLRTDFNSQNFFGAPNQTPTLPASLAGTVIERGDVSVDVGDAGLAAGRVPHVYLLAAGEALVGKFRSTAHPTAGFTAPLPVPAFLDFRAINPINPNAAGRITIR